MTTVENAGSSLSGLSTKRAAWSPAAARAAADVAASTVLLAVGAVAFGPVFGDLSGYVAAGGGAMLGGTIALLSWRRGWSMLGTLVAVMLAYVVLGGALALPTTTVAGVVPTPETLQRLSLLSWQSWRDLLTVATPAGDFEGPAVVPYLSGLVAGVATLTLALRLRHAFWALLPALAFLVVGILWGDYQAPLAAVQGVVFAVASLTWVAWRSQQSRTASAVFGRTSVTTAAHGQRLAMAGGVLALGGLLGVAILPLLGDDERQVLRDDVTPPLDLHDYPSPLTLFRSLSADQEKEPVLTVGGLSGDGRVRLAAMDVYDGNVFNVSDTSAKFVRSGESISPGRYADPEGALRTLSVTVEQYDGVWLPGGSDLRRISFSGDEADTLASGLYVNSGSGTALTTAGIGKGDRYVVDVVPEPAYSDEAREQVPGDAALGAVATAADRVDADFIASAASELAGDATGPLGQLRALEKRLHDDGFFANGQKHPSLAGHSLERVRQLLESPTGQMVGDDEQYAVAMALMARQLGIPARVVMGFYPEKAASAERVTLRGGDTHVWVEALFAGHGWVPFDPTPPEDKEPEQQQPQPRERNDPQVLPPPEVPEERDLRPPAKADSKQKDREEDGPWWLGVLRWTLVGGGAVGVGLAPFVAVAMLKGRRRRLRLTATRPADRVGGGWAELADAATDLGVVVPRHATRQEVGRTIANSLRVDAAPGLAEHVDSHVFGAGDPDDEQVAEVWRRSDEAREAMLSSVDARRRLFARFSTRSLRRPSDQAPRRLQLPRLDVRALANRLRPQGARP